MLQALVNTKSQAIVVLCRGLSTTSVPSGSNKEWLAMRRRMKAKDDLEWDRRLKANQFKTNIGIRNEGPAF